MRIGIDVPARADAGTSLSAHEVGRRAALVEEAGFDGIWLQRATGAGDARPDALQWLLACAATTTTIELGVADRSVPIGHPVDLAHRLITFRALSSDRLTLGVGDAAPDDLDTVRALCRGEAVGVADLLVWDEVRGDPRLVRGPAHEADAPEDAARRFDGWIGSADLGLDALAGALARYRAAGGICVQ